MVLNFRTHSLVHFDGSVVYDLVGDGAFLEGFGTSVSGAGVSMEMELMISSSVLREEGLMVAASPASSSARLKSSWEMSTKTALSTFWISPRS